MQRQFPEGALQKIEEIMAVIDQPGNKTLYKVYAGDKSPATIELDDTCYLKYHRRIWAVMKKIPQADGEPYHSLVFCPGDCNITAHHNGHFIFTNKAQAEAWIATK